MLTEEHLADILESIHRNHSIAPNPEITIECNPDDLTPAYAAMLARLGFNRISMGVQSFCDEQLRRLGRRHTADGAREAVHNARAAGFRNISIDLMFALPAPPPHNGRPTCAAPLSCGPNTFRHITSHTKRTHHSTAPCKRER